MRCAVWALAATLLGAGCSDDGGEGPVIEDLLPAAAAPGATIEIIGDRFCGDDAGDDVECAEDVDAVVNFGAGEQVAAAQIRRYRDGAISVDVPETATPGSTVVVVVRAGVPSNAFEFEIE